MPIHGCAWLRVCKRLGSRRHASGRNKFRMELRSSHILAASAFLTLPVALFVSKGLVPLLAITSVTAFAFSYREIRRWPRFANPLVAVVCALGVWAAVSALWSTTPEKSLVLTVKLAGTMLCGFVLLHVCSLLDAGARDRVERAFLAGVGVSLVLLAVEWMTDGLLTRLGREMVGDPIPPKVSFKLSLNSGLSVTALLVWPVVFGLWRRAHGRVAVGLLVITAGLLSFGDAVTPVLALICGVAAAFAIWLFGRVASGIVLLAVLAQMALAPLAPPALPPLETIVREVPRLPPSLFHRILIWKGISDLIAERPVLGYGMDTARALGRKPDESLVRVYTDKEGNLVYQGHAGDIPLHPHNAPLQVWLELGAIGAALGGAVVFVLFRLPVRSRLPRREASACFGLLVTGLVIASISYGAWQIWWLSALWLAGCWTVVALRGGIGGPEATRHQTARLPRKMVAPERH